MKPNLDKGRPPFGEGRRLLNRENDVHTACLGIW
jgi:hypothetical protein